MSTNGIWIFKASFCVSSPSLWEKSSINCFFNYVVAKLVILE